MNEIYKNNKTIHFLNKYFYLLKKTRQNKVEGGLGREDCFTRRLDDKYR